MQEMQLDRAIGRRRYPLTCPFREREGVAGGRKLRVSCGPIATFNSSKQEAKGGSDEAQDSIVLSMSNELLYLVPELHTHTTVLQQLTSANLALTTSNAALTAANKKLSEALAKVPATTPGTPRSPRPPNKPFPGNYCWTRGHRISQHHTSATCGSKAEGHKDAATASNTMEVATPTKDGTHVAPDGVGG